MLLRAGVEGSAAGALCLRTKVSWAASSAMEREREGGGEKTERGACWKQGRVFKAQGAALSPAQCLCPRERAQENNRRRSGDRHRLASVSAVFSSAASFSEHGRHTTAPLPLRCKSRAPRARDALAFAVCQHVTHPPPHTSTPLVPAAAAAFSPLIRSSFRPERPPQCSASWDARLLQSPCWSSLRRTRVSSGQGRRTAPCTWSPPRFLLCALHGPGAVAARGYACGRTCGAVARAAAKAAEGAMKEGEGGRRRAGERFSFFLCPSARSHCWPHAPPHTADGAGVATLAIDFGSEWIKMGLVKVSAGVGERVRERERERGSVS